MTVNNIRGKTEVASVRDIVLASAGGAEWVIADLDRTLMQRAVGNLMTKFVRQPRAQGTPWP